MTPGRTGGDPDEWEIDAQMSERAFDDCVAMLRELRPLADRDALQEARSNMAPTGLSKSTVARDRLQRLDALLKLVKGRDA
jgi:hypothetical protein